MKAANATGILPSVLNLIGNTPLVQLQRLPSPGSANLLVKLEYLNPGGSVKDRIALAMIEAAEAQGLLKPGGTIVEPTGGNTGIALALVGAAKGYQVILTTPEGLGLERRTLLGLFGAQLVLTPMAEGMAGAVKAAEGLVAQNPDYFMPRQFENPHNPEAHRRTTAQEILRATGGRVDAFVAGIGTGGTITGVGEVLKEKNPRVLVVGVEPAYSPVLSGSGPGKHTIQGLGPNFVPKVLNRGILDRVIPVRDEDAYETQGRLIREEGLLAGVSSGANVFAALQVANELGTGKTVVTLLPDTGERYLTFVP